MVTTRSGLREGNEKRSYVREMFTAIAPRYDLLNHVLSLNIDRSWRRKAVDRLGWERRSTGVYLDLCAGTLDLAAELVGRRRFSGRVVGADFVVPMLRLGLGKAPGLRAVGADALDLPFPDASFDGCTVGFGVRNLTDLEAGLAEAARVLKPGARFVVLEFGTPTVWPFGLIYQWYFRHALPWIGRRVSKHTSAYSYLPQSVAGFPPPRQFTEMLEAAGFEQVGMEPVTLGIAHLFWGQRT